MPKEKLVLGFDDDSVIRRVIEYGASGFIPKKLSLETMVLAIQSVLDGIIWVPNDVDLTVALVNESETQLANGIAMLTPQQFRVLVMLLYVFVFNYFIPHNRLCYWTRYQLFCKWNFFKLIMMNYISVTSIGFTSKCFYMFHFIN